MTYVDGCLSETLWVGRHFGLRVARGCQSANSIAFNLKLSALSFVCDTEARYGALSSNVDLGKQRRPKIDSINQHRLVSFTQQEGQADIIDVVAGVAVVNDVFQLSSPNLNWFGCPKPVERPIHIGQADPDDSFAMNRLCEKRDSIPHTAGHGNEVSAWRTPVGSLRLLINLRT